jgi:L-alanine-DL-glutamate epimerase-like enolase superfamily enzyme
MRLARWSVDSYILPYEREVRWSDVVESAAQFVLLRLESDSGHAGVAEATVKPTWSGVTRRTLEASVEELFIPILQKGDMSDPVAVRQRLDAIPENHAAKALVDNAVWDLHAAKSGKALWQLWGGRRSVEVSWAVTRQAPAPMAKEAAERVERYGFRTLKVKGGQGLAVDVQGMREIRAAVGAKVRLYVDANGFYPMQEAKSYVKAMADAGAEVVEDPCPLLPDAQFEALQQASPVPILVDFGCTSRRDAALFIERGARALSLKPGRFGLSDTRAMLDAANKAGCTTVVGLFGESALGTLGALQLASILPSGALPAETTWFLAMTRQVVKTPVEIRRGAVQLPSIAGLSSMLGL